jgi:hypothetical protein
MKNFIAIIIALLCFVAPIQAQPTDKASKKLQKVIKSLERDMKPFNKAAKAVENAMWEWHPARADYMGEVEVENFAQRYVNFYGIPQTKENLKDLWVFRGSLLEDINEDNEEKWEELLTEVVLQYGYGLKLENCSSIWEDWPLTDDEYQQSVDVVDNVLGNFEFSHAEIHKLLVTNYFHYHAVDKKKCTTASARKWLRKNDAPLASSGIWTRDKTLYTYTYYEDPKY